MALPPRVGAMTAAINLKPKFKVKASTFWRFKPRVKRLPKV